MHWATNEEVKYASKKEGVDNLYVKFVIIFDSNRLYGVDVLTIS